MTFETAGVILAGGRSSRMGTEKSLVPLAGEPMAARVAARLAPQVQRLALNANGDAQRFAFLGLPVLSDTVEGFAGPLAGILAGLRWARAEGFVRIATAASDTPFFPVDLVAELDRAAGSADRIALARSGGRLHPVFALWPTSCADDMDAFLASGRKASVLGFTQAREHALVDFGPLRIGGEQIDPFFNVNTPADLATAERIARNLQA